MIHWGVDPGSVTVALVGISDADGLVIEVLQGTPRPRPSKKNPNPTPLNEYAEAWAMARRIVALVRQRESDFVLAVEGPAPGRRGRQDTLAAARQALFCALWAEDEAMVSRFRTIAIATGKKALTGYCGSDKRRMVEAAGALFMERWHWHPLAFGRYKPKEQEAIADALGIAIASRLGTGTGMRTRSVGNS